MQVQCNTFLSLKSFKNNSKNWLHNFSWQRNKAITRKPTSHLTSKKVNVKPGNYLIGLNRELRLGRNNEM